MFTTIIKELSEVKWLIELKYSIDDEYESSTAASQEVFLIILILLMQIISYYITVG